jgi:hypothetical protein
VAMTLITHPIAFESDSPVGTDIIGTRKLFMMQRMHSSLRKESTDRQPLTTIVNIIVIQQNILCLNMALLIYRVVTSGSIAIVYQIPSMNASVLCSRISEPLWAAERLGRIKGGPSLRDGHSQLSHKPKQSGACEGGEWNVALG